MEEIKQKLTSSCPAVQESAVRRIKERSASSDAAEATEAKNLLWECVRGDDAATSSMAAEAVVSLVKEGKLAPAETVLTLMSLAPQVERPEGLVSAVGEILRCSVRYKHKRE